MCFSKPKLPPTPAPVPLPQTDDEASRRYGLREQARLLSATGGVEGNRMTGSRLGDTSQAETRQSKLGGASILSGQAA